MSFSFATTPHPDAPAAPAASTYRGRFAPSPTGALHAGSLAAALASWLDARAHDGVWLIRIEDLDPPREVPGAAADILDTLAAFGMTSDEAVVYQSTRRAVYEETMTRLAQQGLLYPCTCSRKDIEAANARGSGRAFVYPGTCRGRPALAMPAGASVRIRVGDAVESFDDRAAGPYCQDLGVEVGDFVLRRADGLWSYQWAVVVDDHAQGITDIVRGDDLLDNTPRQIYLQRRLGMPRPRYLHIPTVKTAQDEKLSKQTGAQPVDRGNVLGELERAWQHLGFAPLGADAVSEFMARAVERWRQRWVAASTIGAAPLP